MGCIVSKLFLDFYIYFYIYMAPYHTLPGSFERDTKSRGTRLARHVQLSIALK